MNNIESNDCQSAVLENADLLRVIGEYLAGQQLPLILSFKAVRDALKPLNIESDKKWIKSEKKYFVTSVGLVEWAHSLGCEFFFYNWFNNLFTQAASHGSVDVLRWAHQKYPPNKCPVRVNEYPCCIAARYGNLEVLEYFRSLGSVVLWNKKVSKNAVRGGHLHVIQWLREVLYPPCPWGVDTLNEAAMAGHLNVLQWLRAQDSPCPWGEFTCHYAASQGHFEVLKWLRSQDPPCPWWKQNSIFYARNFNQTEVVNWMLSQPE